MAKCTTCDGRGVYDSHPIPPDTGCAMEFECYTCDGTGIAKPKPADIEALGFVDRCEGGHGRTSIKRSHRAEGRNWVD